MKKPSTFVGADVHASSIALAVWRPDADKPEVSEIPNDPKVIRRTLARLQGAGPLRCCYEAGPCGFELYRQLTAMGIPCDVIAPALIPQRPGERVKTDRRDATKLVRLYRAGELTPIRVPTADEEAVRDLVRAREDIRKDLMAARHRLSKFLLRHGRRYTQGTNWTQRHWAWARMQTFEHAAARATFDHYTLQVHHLEERLRALDADLAQIAASPAYRSAVERLTCLRGISQLSAISLLAELQDLRRFEHPRQLMAFVGLVPSERSSGLKERRGHITKTGNSHARRLLVDAAWSYRHPPALGPRARRLLPGQPAEVVALVKKAQTRLHQRDLRLVGRGKRSPVAVTAVARELCGFLWAVMAQAA